MATQSQRPPRDVVEFAPNVPVTVALKYNQGRRCNSQYGERMMYSTTDGRVMFLDIETAAQVEALGINVGESFSVTRKWSDLADSPATWEISRIPGEQPNGTFMVPAGGSTTGGAVRKPAASQGLVDEANALVDAYAVVLARTLTTYQGRIKPEEARNLLITAYIQGHKLSSVA